MIIATECLDKQVLGSHQPPGLIFAKTTGSIWLIERSSLSGTVLWPTEKKRKRNETIHHTVHTYYKGQELNNINITILLIIFQCPKRIKIMKSYKRLK